MSAASHVPAISDEEVARRPVCPASMRPTSAWTWCRD